MKASLSALAIALVASTPALAKGGVRAAVSWDQLQNNSSGFTLELQSPNFYSASVEGGYEAQFNFYLAASAIDTPNVATNEGGELDPVSSSAVSAGVDWIVPGRSDTFTSYAQFGVVWLSQDEQLAGVDAKPSCGGRLAFGLDFPVSRHTKSWLSDDQSSSLFIQPSRTYGLGRSKALAGHPDLFNGQTLSIGVRVSY